MICADQFGAPPTASERIWGREMNDQKLLTLDELAARLGVSKAWARDHATRRNPRIPVVRLGGKRALLRFRPADVEQFITQHLISAPERGV